MNSAFWRSMCTVVVAMSIAGCMGSKSDSTDPRYGHGKADDPTCQVFVSPGAIDLDGDGILAGTRSEPLRTIAEALASTDSGYAHAGCNEVVLLPGVYTTPFSFGGRAITVRSDAGPEQTTLEPAVPCTGSRCDNGPLVTFDLGETQESVLRGVTLRDATAKLGAAIYIKDASPTIEGCVFENNEATDKGGAVYARNYLGRFHRNVLRGNRAAWGGAVALEALDALVRDGSGAQLTENRFEDNEADWGGAVYLRGENIWDEHTRLDQRPKLERNWFVGNRGESGSGLAASVGRAQVFNNVFWHHNNTTIVLVDAAAIDFVHNTVVDSEHYAIDFGWSTSSRFLNNQFVTAGGAMIVAGNTGTIVATEFRANNFWDAPVFGNGLETATYDNRFRDDNTFIDPGFVAGSVDPAYPGPTIDVGVDPAEFGITTDINGEPRRKGAAWDVGAFETWGLETSDCDDARTNAGCGRSCPVFVAASDEAGGDGTAAHPFPDIQHGIMLRPPGCDDVRVLPGHYHQRIVLVDSSVNLRSTQGAEQTFIEPMITHRPALLISGAGRAPVIEGFTIRASQPRRAFVDVHDSSAIIEQNVFELAAPAEQQQCLSLAAFSGRFADNTVRACAAIGHTSYGLELTDSDGQLVANRFLDNQGSALAVRRGNPLIARNLFSGNQTDGLILSDTSARVVNNVFTNNARMGIYYLPSDLDRLEIVNNTILGGSVGIMTDHSNYARFTNNVIAFQTSLGVRIIGSNLEWRHNLVSAPSNVWSNTSSVPDWELTNLFDVDPMLDASFAPQAGSPCLNAGRADVAPTDDFYGNARDASVTIGAVESH